MDPNPYQPPNVVSDDEPAPDTDESLPPIHWFYMAIMAGALTFIGGYLLVILAEFITQGRY